MAIKRVKVDDLLPGMYVHDLTRGWLSHGFFRSKFLIEGMPQIEKMRREGLTEVLIDTNRGQDVKTAPMIFQFESPKEEEETPTVESQAGMGPLVPPTKRTQAEEAAQARIILEEGTAVVDSMLQDLRFGKQVDTEKARPVVRAITTSVLANPGAIISLGRIKQADQYTFQHCLSVSALMASFAHAMGMDLATVEEAALGGMLHDVGKMKVPLEVLNKPGKLSDEEFQIMKSHAPWSRNLLKGQKGISNLVIQIAGEHHERFGGGGYPNGTSGNAISQIGRMTAIVDVYDALTSNRVYHKGKEPTDVLKILLEMGGTHLDGDLVGQFIRTLGIYPVGSLVQLTSGRLAVVVDQGEDLLRPTVRLAFDTKLKVLLQPKDVYLSKSHEEIVQFEDPEDWGLNTADLL